VRLSITKYIYEVYRFPCPQRRQAFSLTVVHRYHR